MDDDERRALLEAVARGDIAPEDAAAQLRDDAEATSREPLADAGAPSETTAARTGPIRRVRVEATAGSVRVIGDPTITGVDVDGAHDLREDGDTLVVRAQPLRDLDLDLDVDFGERGNRTFVIQRRHGRRLAVHDLKRRIQVTVRMNPSLDLDARVAAGALNVRGIEGAISCDVDAGAARLHDVQGPLDCNVSAGSVTIDGRVVRGDSRVMCDMGACSVRLDRASDVRVTAGPVNVGRCEVHLPDDIEPDASGEFVLGSGTASLEVHGAMSSVSLHVT